MGIEIGKMASEAGEREDSLLEPQRTSLLDIIEDRNRTLNKKTLLHRAVFISKIYHQNFQDIGQYYEKLFRDLQNQYQAEGVTGLLLLFPKHCIHVVESSQELILDVVRDLVAQSNDASTHMEKSKLLIVSHNIPHRLYQHWSHRVIDIEAPRMDAYEPSEDPERLVSDMLTQLLKLGTHLARQPKVSSKNALDSLHESKPELMPPQDVVAYLVEAESLGCVQEPEDYVRLYDQPFDLSLASEFVWPMPTRLFMYNYGEEAVKG